MLKKLLAVLEQFVQTPIQIILLSQAEIFLQQIRHRAVLKPFPMQAPFAARINQSIRRQNLQHMPPGSFLARVRQALWPELVQLKLIPQLTGYPASSPLPRPAQLELIQPDLHPILSGMLGHGPIRRIERQLPRLPQRRIEHLGGLGPTFLLAVVDLSQVKQVPLHPAAPRFDLLGDAPRTMIFAVLEPVMAMQKRVSP